MIYEGKLRIGSQIIRFGGDSIDYASDLTGLVVGVSTLVPSNADTTNTNTTEEEEESVTEPEESSVN